jgi:protein involved in polysaccharide export with SLBB domain
MKQTIEASGVLETEINPDEYIVGPNDEFQISIVSTQSVDLKVIVNPESSLLIPKIGMVQLRGKTLNESYKIIKQEVNKIFKTENIYVALTKVKKIKVTVAGLSTKPTIVQVSSADRVSEAIDKSGGYKYQSSLRNIKLIRNINNVQKEIDVDLIKYYNINDKNSNPLLQGGDYIVVYPTSKDYIVSSYGELHFPSLYELKENDSLSTLVKLSGGFTPMALLDSVEIVRYNEAGDNLTKYILDLTSWKNINNITYNLKHDFKLEKGDKIFVRKKNLNNVNKEFAFGGEVQKPGRYSIEEGKTRLSDVLKECGGFTAEADLENSTFLRYKDRLARDIELERLEKIKQTEMTKSELQYFQAKIREKKGLMAIDLKKVLKDENSPDNILLVTEDSLYVPKKRDYINVIGRVNSPGFVKFNTSYKYLDYINAAGGFGYKADEDAIIIAKVKGDQYEAESNKYKLEPGDSILVPPQKEVTAFEIFKDGLTIVAQIVTVFGVIITLARF